jgi:DnaJ family protein B protein 1
LEELFNGCTKKISYNCQIVNQDGRISSLKEQCSMLYIKPGFKQNHSLTFPQKGHQVPGQQPGDLVFIIKEKSHNGFKREGDDLHFTCGVPLVDAINIRPVELVFFLL